MKHADVSNFNKTDMVVMETSDLGGDNYRIYSCIRGEMAEVTVLQDSFALPCFTHIKGADQLASNAICSAPANALFSDIKNV